MDGKLNMKDTAAKIYKKGAQGGQHGCKAEGH